MTAAALDGSEEELSDDDDEQRFFGLRGNKSDDVTVLGLMDVLESLCYLRVRNLHVLDRILTKSGRTLR